MGHPNYLASAGALHEADPVGPHGEEPVRQNRCWAEHAPNCMRLSTVSAAGSQIKKVSLGDEGMRLTSVRVKAQKVRAHNGLVPVNLHPKSFRQNNGGPVSADQGRAGLFVRGLGNGLEAARDQPGLLDR